MKTSFQNIKTVIEERLYKKLAVLIEAAKMQEAAGILNEADPKPRVEKDHEGKPVVPTTDQYKEYFEAMAAEHIQAQLDTVKERWKLAAEAKDAEAQKEALKHELEAATEVLKSK